MPHYTKDGKPVWPKQTIVDDLTFRDDISRQRKYQIRARRAGCCVGCGIPLEYKNKIRKGTIVVDTDEKCPKCYERTKQNKLGFLQGREERIESVEDNAEGFVD